MQIPWPFTPTAEQAPPPHFNFETVNQDGITETKTCNKCKQEKPLTDFWKDSQAKDGHFASCKSCGMAMKKERKERAKSQASSKENKERFYTYLNTDLSNRMKNIVFHTNGESIKSFVHRAMETEIKRIEKLNGGKFPQRGSQKQPPNLRIIEADGVRVLVDSSSNVIGVVNDIS